MICMCWQLNLKKTKIFLATTLLALMGLTGSVKSTPLELDYHDPKVRQFWKEFLTKRNPPEVVIAKTIKSTDLYNKFYFKLKEDTRIEKYFEIDFYQSKQGKKNKKPLLMIYPGITGVNLLDRSIAHAFNKKGYHVAISHYFDESLMNKIENIPINMLDTLKVSLSSIDFLTESQHDISTTIDPQKVALFGISFGAIRASYQMAFDDRIGANVLVVAGFPVSDILVHSKMRYLENIRKKHIQKGGYHDTKEYQKALEEQGMIKIEEFWKHRSNHDVLLISALQDSWVPTFTQERLWNALGQPQRRLTNCGHLKTSLKSRTKYMETILKFVSEQLGVASDNPTMPSCKDHDN